MDIFNNYRQAEVLRVTKSSILYKGKKYYYKPNHNSLEFVVEIIAKKLNLKTATYISKKIMGLPYYFSEDLNQKGEFITAEGLGLEGNCLPEAFDFFEKKYPEYLNSLSYDLIKVYLMDIILMNHDRNNENWGIIVIDNIPRICILDNELSFNMPITSISSKRKKPDYIRKYLSDDSLFEDTYTDINYFLENYNITGVATFKILLRILTPEFINELFDLVEQEYKVKIEGREILLEQYMEHYTKLQELLNNITLRRKK